MEGRAPASVNSLSCVSLLVSRSISSAASLGCLPCLGAIRWVPPWLPPPPPGTAATSHLPEVVGAASLMLPVFHDGQTIVAKEPLVRPVFHGGLKAASLADSSACSIWTDRSHAFRTSGLVPATRV